MANRAGPIGIALNGGLRGACREFEQEGAPAEERFVERLLGLNLLRSLVDSGLELLPDSVRAAGDHPAQRDVPGEQAAHPGGHLQH